MVKRSVARAEPRAVWVCSGIVVCRRILNLARLHNKKESQKNFLKILKKGKYYVNQNGKKATFPTGGIPKNTEKDLKKGELVYITWKTND